MTNMVVCPEPLAARAGQEAYAAGGNAVDAAVAAAFAQGVTNPLNCGLGGMGLMYYYDAARGEGVVLNCSTEVGSIPVPKRWAEECRGRAETVGRYIVPGEANQMGYQSVMIPGFVKGCWDAFNRFGSGRVSWAELLAPAERLAREGFEIYPYVAAHWLKEEEKPGYPGVMRVLHATPDATRFYLKPDGSGYRLGDRLVQPDVARTIRRLAEAGGDDFYHGEIAQMIAQDFARHDGFIAPEDLSGYQVKDHEPVRGRYRGLEVTSTPPPSSGTQIVEMLQILEHFDLAKIGHNTPEYVDLFARVQRATFADNVRLKGIHPEAGAELARQFVGLERAAYWAKRIEAGDRIVVRGGAVDTGTTHVTCVDEQRNVVSFTHSIGILAGSGVITPGLGFLYNDFLGHFNPVPGQYDSIEPGKRLGGGLPTIIFKDGRPYIAVGAPGGSRLITAVTQSVVNAVTHGMDMKTAVSVPRFHSEEKQLLFIEPAFPESTAEALRALGNEVERSTYMSRVQAIRALPNGELEAGPDPRGGAGVGRHP